MRVKISNWSPVAGSHIRTDSWSKRLRDFWLGVNQICRIFEWPFVETAQTNIRCFERITNITCVRARMEFSRARARPPVASIVCVWSIINNLICKPRGRARTWELRLRSRTVLCRDVDFGSTTTSALVAVVQRTSVDYGHGALTYTTSTTH